MKERKRQRDNWIELNSMSSQTKKKKKEEKKVQLSNNVTGLV